MLVGKDFCCSLQCGRAVPAKVSLVRWNISRLMVSGRVDRQKHGIEKVCSSLGNMKGTAGQPYTTCRKKVGCNREYEECTSSVG